MIKSSRRLPSKPGIRYTVFFLLFAFCSSNLYSCRNPNERIPDVSGIKVNLKSSRFDKDLYSIDTNHIAEGLQKLAAKYPNFLNYYLDTIMAYGIHGNFSDTTKAITDGLRPFLTYKDFVALEDTILKYYPDSKETDEAISSGFKFMTHYYPGIKIPEIIYVNMELRNFPVFPLDNATLCIGLDMFLGEQYPFYKSVGVPGYMAAHLRKSYLPVSVFSALYMAAHPLVQDDRTLIDLMIQRGKEQYFLHRILPHTPDSVLFGFKESQLQWCNNNEAVIYNFFVRQNLLYNKDPHSVQQYIHDAPYAHGLESSSDEVKVTPGNIGTWLGYKIVSSYMAQHPKMTLKELTEFFPDPAKFLDEARYRPK